MMAGPQERGSRLLGTGEIQVSFEFFPPKSAKMEEALWAAIRRLEPMRPEFVSVTYGAGGSTRERTHTTVSRIVRGLRRSNEAKLANELTFEATKFFTVVGAYGRSRDYKVRLRGRVEHLHVLATELARLLTAAEQAFERRMVGLPREAKADLRNMALSAFNAADRVSGTLRRRRATISRPRAAADTATTGPSSSRPTPPRKCTTFRSTPLRWPTATARPS